MRVVFESNHDTNAFVSFFKENPYTLLSLVVMILITIRWLYSWKIVRSNNGPFMAFMPSPRNVKIAKEIIDTIGEFRPSWWYNPHIGKQYMFAPLYTLN
jgi:L-asparagine transporter-like permease